MASEYKPNFGVTPITASITLFPDTYAGRTGLLSAAAGLTVTLPAATGTGASYTLTVGTTVTSNGYIVKVANATDIIQGVVSLTTDIAGTAMPTAGTTDTITMNGSTTGGLKGSSVTLQDVASGLWHLTGELICTGTEATPFSATVS